MDVNESIRRQFGASAAAYAVSPVHAQGPDLGPLVEAGVRTGRERVLDVGCGAGHTALAFAPRVAEVTALDITDEMLAQTELLARERGQTNVHTRRGDASALPFEDASFDVVASRYSAHHYARPGAFVREAARVLRPRGVLLLVDSIAPADPALDTFENAFELLRDASHVRNHTAAQWSAMLEAAGLAAEWLSTWAIPLEFDSWVARIGTPPTAVAQLREMFATANDAAREAFEVAADGAAFSLPAGLLRGVAPAAPASASRPGPRSQTS